MSKKYEVPKIIMRVLRPNKEGQFMKLETWIKHWITKRIKYYEAFLQNHPRCGLKREIQDSIHHLKELL